jgi:hypothetical protein
MGGFSLLENFSVRKLQGIGRGVQKVLFLFLIDLLASSDSYVFSTLTFLAEQAIRYTNTSIFTFDQPSCWKSMMIISNSEDSSPIWQTVLKLGGFTHS